MVYQHRNPAFTQMTYNYDGYYHTSWYQISLWRTCLVEIRDKITTKCPTATMIQVRVISTQPRSTGLFLEPFLPLLNLVKQYWILACVVIVLLARSRGNLNTSSARLTVSSTLIRLVKIAWLASDWVASHTYVLAYFYMSESTDWRKTCACARQRLIVWSCRHKRECHFWRTDREESQRGSTSVRAQSRFSAGRE